MWINQDAYFSIGKFKAGTKTEYTIRHKGNGAYVFQIEGTAVVAEKELNRRDAVGVWDTDKFNVEVRSDSEILVVEVPMN
jgi:redox-sensitive bicupin YhaK (pirin superfamily)